jgi:hypothetical protein
MNSISSGESDMPKIQPRLETATNNGPSGQGFTSDGTPDMERLIVKETMRVALLSSKLGGTASERHFMRYMVGKAKVICGAASHYTGQFCVEIEREKTFVCCAPIAIG